MGIKGKYGFRFYPAAWSGALTTILAAVVAFGFIPQTAANYVTASGVAVLGLVSAFLARPWVVPTITASMATFLTSLAGFGLHLSDAKIAGVMGIATMVLTWVTHTNIVPKAGSPSWHDPRLHPLVGAPGVMAEPPAGNPTSLAS